MNNNVLKTRNTALRRPFPPPPCAPPHSTQSCSLLCRTRLPCRPPHPLRSPGRLSRGSSITLLTASSRSVTSHSLAVNFDPVAPWFSSAALSSKLGTRFSLYVPSSRPNPTFNHFSDGSRYLFLNSLPTHCFAYSLIPWRSSSSTIVPATNFTICRSLYFIHLSSDIVVNSGRTFTPSLSSIYDSLRCLHSRTFYCHFRG